MMRPKFVCSPSPAKRMCFRVKHNIVEIQSPWGCEKEIEVLEGFGEDKALHFITLLLADDVGKRRITGVAAAICDEIFKDRLAHFLISPVLRVMIEIVGGFNNLRSQMVRTRHHAHRFVIDDFWLDSMQVPHLEG